MGTQNCNNVYESGVVYRDDYPAICKQTLNGLADYNQRYLKDIKECQISN